MICSTDSQHVPDLLWLRKWLDLTENPRCMCALATAVCVVSTQQFGNHAQV